MSIIPERFWRDAGRGARPRYHHPDGARAVLSRLSSQFPLIAHGLGLSIASACFFDRAHVRQLQRMDRELRFRWISEHLAAFRVDDEQRGGRLLDHHAGIQIPLAWDRALLALVSRRVDAIHQALGRPILLENSVEFTPIADAQMSEPEFWHALCDRTGVGLLLDLHNLHTNAMNLGIDPMAWLEAIPAAAVREIHVAGGSWIQGLYYDSHSGRTPREVIALLRASLGRFPNLEGITFELHESYMPEVRLAGIAAELRALRRVIAQGAGEEHVAG